MRDPWAFWPGLLHAAEDLAPLPAHVFRRPGAHISSTRGSRAMAKKLPESKKTKNEMA